MSDLTKINSTHLSRLAYVYLRQSSPAQVAHNRESTARQYALVAKAADLGWPAQQVLVIDEDLGVSGSGIVERSGFARLTAEVAVRLHPHAAVPSAVRTVFTRFAALGSVRRVWLWLRSEGLTFPMQTHYGAAIRWIDPSYAAIYHVLTNPAYAGAYVYGKSRRQITLDATGRRKRQTRKLPRSEWSVLIPEHHPGFIDWATYEANRSRIAANTHPQPHHSGGAVREGSALLQGLASCGACGRRLRTHYTGRTASPGYHCAGKNIVDGRGIFCLSVGAVQIDDHGTRSQGAAANAARRGHRRRV